MSLLTVPLYFGGLLATFSILRARDVGRVSACIDALVWPLFVGQAVAHAAIEYLDRHGVTKL